jgi:hypothetical protein
MSTRTRRALAYRPVTIHGIIATMRYQQDVGGIDALVVDHLDTDQFVRVATAIDYGASDDVARDALAAALQEALWTFGIIDQPNIDATADVLLDSLVTERREGWCA